MGITRHTRRMIILFLATIGRPARTSEIRAAVVKDSLPLASERFWRNNFGGKIHSTKLN
jgi:hypothetical protein